MNGFFDRRAERIGSGTGARTERVTDAFCPLLCEALQGPWDDEHKRHGYPAYGLSVFMEGPIWKVCLWCDDNQPRWFASFDSSEALLERVEELLKEGKGDWRKPKAQERPRHNGK